LARGKMRSTWSISIKADISTMGKRINRRDRKRGG